MLHDDGRGPPEFHGEFEGRFEVHKIVVGKLLALELARRGETSGGGSRGDVKRRALMRIFAVAQFLPARERKMQPLGQQRALAKLDRTAARREALEFRRDLAVVARGERERLARQLQPRREAHFSVRRDFGGDGGVVGGIGDHGNALEIFCGRANHGRPADVDVLDQILGSQVRLRGGRFKGIEIHDDKIDGRNLVFRGLRAVARLSAPEQNAAMHFRVQRLHAPAQHLRPSGQVGNVAHGDSRFAQQLGRAAGGNDLDPARGQLPHKFRQPALVINTHQRAFHRHRILQRMKGKRLLYARARESKSGNTIRFLDFESPTSTQVFRPGLLRPALAARFARRVA